ncbi:MAG: SpoIIE family protein phosphatase [Spirochaetes bacterium]|nr:SpoIIE family protein phosphatase [Spirochaetota bacterium]
MSKKEKTENTSKPEEKKNSTKADKKSAKEAADAEKEAKKAAKVKFSLRNKFYIILIPLVGIIIFTMSYYFIREETSLLTNEIVKFAEREIEHLGSQASLSLLPDADILSLIDALRNLENVPSIKYAYIFNAEKEIVQAYSIEKGISEPDKNILSDEITKKAVANTDIEKPLLLQYPDPDDTSGMIYDFSIPVMHPIFKDQRTGTVRLGFSDKIIRDATKKITKTISMIAAAFLIIAIIGAIILARMTIGPVRKLSYGASMIGSGDLDYKIRISTSDELGRLAHEFNEMTEHLKKAKEREVESRVMEEQLELAKEIQEGLNPMGFYEKDGVQIKGFTRAAKGVGGDYFDYIDIDKNRVGALISDVSGKGVPASLVMVMIRTVFVSYISRKDVQCASVVRAINDSLSADFAIDKFATLFFMIYNRATEEIAFSNAGHGPLFCYRSSLDACSITKLDGMPIGIMEDVEYKQAKVKLSKGDIIALYTDGITEMRNKDKEEYGLQRLQQLLMKNSNMKADELIDLIVNDVDSFRGEVPPHDDMTVLILKRD